MAAETTQAMSLIGPADNTNGLNMHYDGPPTVFIEAMQDDLSVLPYYDGLNPGAVVYSLPEDYLESVEDMEDTLAKSDHVLLSRKKRALGLTALASIFGLGGGARTLFPERQPGYGNGRTGSAYNLGRGLGQVNSQIRNLNPVYRFVKGFLGTR